MGKLSAEEYADMHHKACARAAELEADYENQIAELMAGMDQAEAERDRALARVGALEGALEKCLDHETRRAKLSGLSDCACMNYSRDSERAYEMGQCPHQLARQALDKLDGDG